MQLMQLYLCNHKQFAYAEKGFSRKGPDGFADDSVDVPPTLCRQALDVDSFGCQESEAGVDVLDLDGRTNRHQTISLFVSFH